MLPGNRVQAKPSEYAHTRKMLLVKGQVLQNSLYSIIFYKKQIYTLVQSYQFKIN